MYKYLLFDADNTLLDFDCAERAAFHEAIEGYPIEYGEETYGTYHKMNKAEWLRLEKGETDFERLRVDRFVRFLEAYGCDGSQGAELSRTYEGRLATHAPLMPNAQRVLKDLSKKYDIYIVTNGITEVQKSRLSVSELLPYIKKCFISMEIGYSKPDRQFFETVFQSVGDGDTENYLVIGDSLTGDIAGAYGCGVDSVWIRQGDIKDPRPRYTITDLSELLEIL